MEMKKENQKRKLISSFNIPPTPHFAFAPIFAFFSLIVIFLLSLGSVSACSCIVPQPVSYELRNNNLVFMGKVVNMSETGSNPFDALEVAVTFNVDRKYKGDFGNNDKTITLVTSGASASCGYPFEKNKNYIVYAREFEGRMSVSLCSRTSLVNDATEDVAFLNKLNHSMNPYGENMKIIVKNSEELKNKDPYTLNEAYLDGSLLVLNVSYPGCNLHDFELRAQNSFSKSLPPQKEIYLYHDKGDDENLCEYINQEILTFDFDELSKPYSTMEVVLNLHNSNGEIVKLTNTLTNEGEGQEIPTDDNGVKPEPIKVSFFQRIKNWFKNIFQLIDSIQII